MDQLTPKIQDIVDRPISLANETLYEICKNQGKYIWGNSEFLGEKIWLIGRSYAASPERRYIKNKFVKEKLNLDTVGDGSGKYFIEIGTYIINDPRYSQLISKIKELQEDYKFDNNKSDILLLAKSIKVVAQLNEMIKAASLDYDKRYNPKIIGNVTHKNQISFCSKFLHFHCPHTVFIMDHFVKETSLALFSTRSKKLLHIDDIEITKEFKQSLQNYLPSITATASPEVADYAEHCRKSYALCCFINDSNFDTDRIVSYPRTTDYILQDIKYCKDSTTN